jgi:hypothetical protein
MKYSNGVYDGEWKDGVRHGQGKMKDQSGEYDGEWLDGKRHGQGVMKYSNGDVYDGKWQDNQFRSFKRDAEDIEYLQTSNRVLQDQVGPLVDLIAEHAPRKRQKLEDVPLYYRRLHVNSQRGTVDVPWNEHEKRPMTMMEGVNCSFQNKA